MVRTDLATIIEDHALERVPDDKRESWLTISWNTVGLITTLVIMFFGALVCFVAGVKIALLAGVTSFLIGGCLSVALARIAVDTGYSNTLITRKYGLGVRGSALASVIFGFLIVGFLAVENGLLYRGFLFYFAMDDDWFARILLYGLMTVAWIVLTAWGFAAVTRTSSLMTVGFLVVLVWMMSRVLIGVDNGVGAEAADVFLFSSQLESSTLASMGITTNTDKFVFALNLLVGPACALALNTADFGRYGKSTRHVATAAMIAIFLQSLVMMVVGGVLMKSAAPAMIAYFTDVTGVSEASAGQQLLQSPDSIAATFMVFGGVTGFLLMILAQAKAQVLNNYSSSLCIANLFDALFRWRPGRLTFVVLANVIALAMLYGEILHFVEEWIKLLGVLLSALAATIIVDYYFVSPRIAANTREPASINWAGVTSIIAAVITAHWLLQPFQPIEVLTSLICVAVLYPALRLTIFRPANNLTAGAARL